MRHETVPETGEPVPPPPEIDAALATRKRARKRARNFNADAVRNIAAAVRDLGLGEALADPALAYGVALDLRDRLRSAKYAAAAGERGREWIGPEAPPVATVEAPQTSAEASADMETSSPGTAEQVDDVELAYCDPTAAAADMGSTPISDAVEAPDRIGNLLDGDALVDAGVGDPKEGAMNSQIASVSLTAEATSPGLKHASTAPVEAASSSPHMFEARDHDASPVLSSLPPSIEEVAMDLPGPFLKLATEANASRPNRVPPRGRIPGRATGPRLDTDADAIITSTGAIITSTD